MNDLINELNRYSTSSLNFVGRQAEIEEIRALLLQNKILELVGDDGVGKKDFVNAYIKKYHKEYQLVHFFRDPAGSTAESLVIYQNTLRYKKHLKNMKFLFVFRDIGSDVNPIVEKLFSLNSNSIRELTDNQHIIFIKSIPTFLNYKPVQMKLNPLSITDSRSLIDKLEYLKTLDEVNIDKLHQISKGNPLILEQINSYYNYFNKEKLTLPEINEFLGNFINLNSSTEVLKKIVAIKIEQLFGIVESIDDPKAFEKSCYGAMTLFDEGFILHNWLDTISLAANIPYELSKKRNTTKQLDPMVKGLLSIGLINNANYDNKIYKQNVYVIQSTILNISRELNIKNISEDYVIPIFCLATRSLSESSKESDITMHVLWTHLYNFCFRVLPKYDFDAHYIFLCNRQIASVLANIFKDIEMGLYFTEKSLKLIDKLDLKIDDHVYTKAEILADYGIYLCKYDELSDKYSQESINSLLEAKEMYNSNKELGNSSFICLNLSSIYYKCKMYDKARDELIEALKKPVNEEYELLEITVGLLTICLEMGDIKSVKMVIPYGEKIIKDLKKWDSFTKENYNYIYLICRDLYLCYIVVGDSKNKVKTKQLLEQISRKYLSKSLSAYELSLFDKQISKELDEAVQKLLLIYGKTSIVKSKSTKNILISSTVLLAAAYLAFKFFKK